jgi:hypothetical protein
MPLLDRLAAYLREKDLIAIYYLPNDQQSTVFLLYPTGSVTFGFLDCRSRIPYGVALRVAVRDRFFTFDHLLSASPTNASHPQLPGTRESLKDISTLSCSDSPEKPKSIKAQHPSRPSHPQLPGTRESLERVSDTMDLPKDISTLSCSDSPEKPKSIKAQHPSTSSSDAKMAASPDGGQSAVEIDLDLFFREQFRITFDELATVQGKGVAGMTFLMFPVDAHEELTLLSEYLRRHQVVIFSNRFSEDWERFVKVVKEGIVLVSYNNRWQLATHFVLTWDDA